MSAAPSRPLTALHYFATDRSLPIADFARAAAERGFDAVLLPEHTHIPVGTEAPYPGGGEPAGTLPSDARPVRRAFRRRRADRPRDRDLHIAGRPA